MNPVDLEEKRNLFRESNQIIEIENFLKEEEAEKMHQFLTNKIPEDWWVRSVFMQSSEYPTIINEIQNNENQIKINYLTELANQSFCNNIFSYSFDKTTDHYSTCLCEFCLLKRYINSGEFMDAISQIVDIKLTRMTETFASRYTEGCFLSPHHDKTKGKIGFVMNFTKNWRPEYGGMLHMTDKNNENKINQSFTPKFNQLILFYIPQPEGIPHFVSHVVPGIKDKRVAVTGWFN